MKFLSISLKNYRLKDWRCGGKSETAATSKIEFIVTIVHGYQPLITTVKISLI